MITTFFGLHRRPFRSTPDAEAYYPATGHEQVLDRLVKALNDEENPVVLVGEVGRGKTLLAGQLVERLGGNIQPALVTHSHLCSATDLLQAILFDLGQPYQGRSEQELRLQLSDVCLTRFEQGGRTVVVIDEAQNLPPHLLEEIRLLGNLESQRGKALQFVLIGLPMLLAQLACPEAHALRQRVVTCVELPALDRHESADYLLHLVRQAGGEAEAIFTPEALDLLAQASGGVPRVLNQLGHRALQFAHEVQVGCVDAEVALEAIQQLGHPTPVEDEPLAEAAPASVAYAPEYVEPQPVAQPAVILDCDDASLQLPASLIDPYVPGSTCTSDWPIDPDWFRASGLHRWSA